MDDIGVRPRIDGKCIVVFKPSGKIIEVEQGTLLLDAAKHAGVDITTPCGGFGRCGKCKVQIEMGEVSRRQTSHLTQSDIEKGVALACMTVVKGDAIVYVEPKEAVKLAPPQETTAERIALPIACEWQRNPRIRKYYVEIEPPTLADATNDFDRLKRELKLKHGIENVYTSLHVLKNLPTILRQDEWKVTAVLETDSANDG